MIIPDLTLTNDSLAELVEFMPGRGFGDPQRRRFLECATSVHVQAAPGTGKTTLLVAKLEHLARRWLHPHRGMCVISHTNAARIEIEQKLGDRSSAYALLRYPHFVGTVTGFLHQFHAFPLLRGLGWPIKWIDQDAFATMALARAYRKPTLRASLSGANGRAVKEWIRTLCLSPDFVIPVPAQMTAISIRSQTRMPGAGTPSRQELEEIKAELIAEGVFNFADLVTLAERSLNEYPAIAHRLADRFPIVFMDEAQDTAPDHMDLILRVFNGRSVIQCLGDKNQSIFDHESESGAEWNPDPDPIDLGDSLRFGRQIAQFATRLTVRREQVITGTRANEAQPTILLFDENSISRVLPTYAQILCRAWPNGFTSDFQAWAVATRHRAAEGAASWPQSLSDYYPGYRVPGTKGVSPEHLVAALRDLVFLSKTGESLADYVSRFAAAIVELLRLQSALAPEGERWTAYGLWRQLDASVPGTSSKVRRILRDCLVSALDIESEAGWSISRGRLIEILGPLWGPVQLSADASNYLAFVPPLGNTGPPGNALQPKNMYEETIGDQSVCVRLGSIHSVKGQTHDATLVLETPMINVMDLKTALATVFGRRALPTATEKNKYRAVTNVFVAATRPKHLLCLAVRKLALTADQVSAASAAGWDVQDLTGS